jgi:hypothetical protein
VFKEKLGLKEQRDMSELLTRAQPCINYDEKLCEEEVEKDKSFSKNGDQKRREDDDQNKFTECTPLNTEIERGGIL